jgi:formyltetrahydrofolate deformylase
MRPDDAASGSGSGAQPARLLLVECPDQRGLVHRITGVLFRHGCNVTSNHEFVDEESGRFFMRTEFSGEMEPEGGEARLAPTGRRRVVVLVSREHHCLAELLVRCTYGEINAELLAVVSNHETLAPLVNRFGIPFHHVPHEGRSREEHEAALLQLLEPLRPEWLVLAKYMRILSASTVARYRHQIVNIHHSFLPAFAGAKPYLQAFRRGVKVIGATAHFVTEQLDEGPIIMQQVIPVDHRRGPADLAQAGRDVEQMVLAQALRLVLEERVFLSGNRTVIFD